MAAVSDTSAISNLALIGRLELLRNQFQTVWIPEAVAAELDRLTDTDARAAIQAAIQEAWIRIGAPLNRQLIAGFARDLDAGEAEAIVLAIEIKAELLLIDEREGRAIARDAGLKVRGILGVLIRAKAVGDIVSIKDEIAALREDAGFFIAPGLEAEILQSAGE
jgi:predicted nucleic acid-binding protein